MNSAVVVFYNEKQVQQFLSVASENYMETRFEKCEMCGAYLHENSVYMYIEKEEDGMIDMCPQCADEHNERKDQDDGKNQNTI